MCSSWRSCVSALVYTAHMVLCYVYKHIVHYALVAATGALCGDQRGAQNCPPARIVLLLAVATLLYLSTLPSVRRLLHRLITPAPPAPAAAAAAPQPAEGAAGPAQAAAQEPAARNVGVLHELRALVIGFFTSLLPGAWCMGYGMWRAVVYIVLQGGTTTQRMQRRLLRRRSWWRGRSSSTRTKTSAVFVIPKLFTRTLCDRNTVESSAAGPTPSQLHHHGVRWDGGEMQPGLAVQPHALLHPAFAIVVHLINSEAVWWCLRARAAAPLHFGVESCVCVLLRAPRCFCAACIC